MAVKVKQKSDHSLWRMTRRERVFYYTGDTGRLFCQSILNTFMTTFLIFNGVKMTSIAGIMLVLKLIDAFDDVIFGFLVDRFDPQKLPLIGKLAGEGKYLPWYRATFFLYPLAILIFFLMPKGLSITGKLAWFAVTYLLYDLTSTLAEVPVNSMVMTLTDSVDERNNVLKIKGLIAVIGAVGIGVLWQFLTSEHVGLSIRGVAMTSAIVFLISMFPLAIHVKEHNIGLKNVEEEKEEKYTLKEMAACIRTNRFILIFFLSQIVITCLQTSTALSTFVSFYCYGDSMIISLATLIAFVPGIIMTAKADSIAKRFGRRNSIILMNMISGAMLLILYFVGYSSVALSITLLLIASLPGTVKIVLNNYIAPDTIEYTRYKTGQDCSGIFYSLNSFVTKVTGSVASSLGMFVLGLGGWIDVEATDFADLAAQNIQQPASAIGALWACNALIPAVGCLVGCGILLFYTLKDKDAELMAQCNSGHISREECEARLSRKYR